MATEAQTTSETTMQGFTATSGNWRQYVAALRILVALTLVLGFGYPAVITGVAQLPGLRNQAAGSLVHDKTGHIVGSSLLAQGFTNANGEPLRQWFQPRPSAAGNGWDASSSSASNLGPNNPDLIAAITQRKKEIAAFDSTPDHTINPENVPADAVTTSASGLDPQISPHYAQQQVHRVAQARNLPPEQVAALVSDHIQGRVLGVLGAERVNVLELNLALERLNPRLHP